MEVTIRDRIGKFIKYLGISTRKFEIECGLTNGYVAGTSENGYTAPKLMQIFQKYPTLSTRWLLLGEGQMLRNTVSENSDIATEPEPTITPAPVLETETGKVVSGNQKTGCNTGKILPLNLLNINTSIEEYAQQNELLDYCPCDFITPFTFAYQIQSDTLYPDYNVGDWILIKKINFSEVRIGKTYFIDTRSKGKMIKRVDYNNNSLILSLPKRPWLCPILNIDKNDILSEIYGIYDIIFQLRKTDELPPTHENNDLVKQNADFIEIAKTAMHNQEKTLGLLQDTIEIIKRKF